MYGAKPFSSTLMRRALSASQFASSPSPSEVARPMPVIQTSAAPGFEDFVSVMRDGLLRKADAFGHRVHVHTQFRIREGDNAERDRGVASQFAANADFGGRNRITRALVNDTRLYREQLAGADKSSHLGFLDRGQERHPLEFHQGDQQPAGC